MRELAYPFNLFDLNGQVVIITGGLGKLGSQFAKTLVQANAKVATFDITEKPNQELEELAREYPLLFLKVDITSENSVKKGLIAIEKQWGIPTILINNAGWKASPNNPQGAGEAFEEYPIDLWERVFKVNVTGAAICAKIIGKRIIEAEKNGVIINIVSQYALVAPDQRIYDYRQKIGKNKFVKDASYGASKAALVAMTRDLAIQWAPRGIRVVAVAFGGVLNPASDKEFIESYSQRVPLGRMANVDEYNGAILFLASGAASYMTGTTLVLDGGFTSW
ncbi:MAG: SDR family oxidoreductase [Candidatus Yanofskybacteria bacterium]|nr:SDR family oxidoreductase [Candidatus Yanofskybacteria bacterium]